MDTRPTRSSIKFMEAIRAIQAYKNCSAEEAIELLTIDISKFISEHKEEIAYRLRDVAIVAFESFFYAAKDAGLDLDDFFTIVPDSYVDAEDNPGDVDSSDMS